tara:strand:+ start:1849 stop:2802 length:954 start_codon:yes stop_codon:yes gene_type:complete
MEKVLITGPLIGNSVSRLVNHFRVEYSKNEVMNQTAFSHAVKDAWGIVTMTSLSVDRHIIDSSPQLKVISNLGVGCDNIDVSYAQSKGITVTNTPDVLSESTAEMAMGLLLATSRRIIEGDHMVKAGGFSGWKVDLLLGSELNGKTLGILGCGSIGQAIARIAGGFEMQVLYCNRSRLPDEVETRLHLSAVDFDGLLEKSDFLVITTPLNKESHHLFDLKAFERMKTSAILVNIGRGPVIKEVDLIAALETNLIAAVALDVFEMPPNVAEQLKTRVNVTLTPHLGSATTEARSRMSDLVINAILDVHEGRVPDYVVS